MKKYTKKETEKLIKYNAQGKGPKEIANLMSERSYSSVRSKLFDLGLTVKTFEPEIKLGELEEKVLKQLNKGKFSILELANKFDVGPKTINQTVNHLHEKGYNVNPKDDYIQLRKEGTFGAPFKINVEEFFGGKPQEVLSVTEKDRTLLFRPTTNFKFGAIADTHIGSKYERMDILNALYDIFHKEKIKIVFHGGNYVDGEFRYNKFETYTHGFDDMIDNFLKKYPQKKGITTYFIDGDDHEGWWTQREGLETGRVIQDRARQIGRGDLVYLGYQEANIVLKTEKGQSLMKIIHAGGGTAYATSWRAQKIAESFTTGEKPDINLMGHYHKAEYGTPRGIHTIQMGCTQDQTRFMRKKPTPAHLGGWIIEINQGTNGEINRFKPEFLQFFNKDLYKSKITSK